MFNPEKTVAAKTEEHKKESLTPEEEAINKEIIESAEADAAQFQKYMDDPAAFTAETHKQKGEKAKEGIYIGNEAETMRLLYNAGVRPDDLVEVGKREAVELLTMRTMEQEIKHKSNFMLRVLKAGLRLKSRGAGAEVDHAFPAADQIVSTLLPNQIEGIGVRPLLFQINPTNSPEVEKYNDAFRRYQDIEELLVRVGLEISGRFKKTA